MDNPNEDEGYARYSLALHEAIGGLWESGATLDNIQGEIESALENATGEAVRASLHVSR